MQKLGYITLSNEMSKIDPLLCHPRPTQRGGYGSESVQHQRLQNAQKLLLRARPDADENLKAQVRECALKACSWGLGQIMGFNHKLAGFATLQDFINEMYESEKAQLQAMINFLKSAGLTGAMKRKDWHAIARAYNGVAYAEFDYHNKLARVYERT
ncbi:N-acetylmuramidase domain-containing protein [Moraxella bovoculi]|uniref:N-acetylmuramidase domain-containing protein n=1 Tax=Moraxella bovoculi TaxID=386891 RepID=UPI003F4FF6C0